VRLQQRLAQWLVRAAQLPISQQARGGFLLQLGLSNLDLRPIATKKDQLDNYVGWVYACVSTIAQDLRTNPWNIWVKKGKRKEEWEPLAENKIPLVFKSPNPIDKTWGQFSERRNLHKDTTGEAYWHLITTKPGGKILGMEFIQPDRVEEAVLDDTKKRLIGWRVTDVGVIDARDVIPDFYLNPRDPLRGASPIEAFALAHHLDLYLRAYGVKMVRDGSSIAQYVKTDQELTPEQADAIEERLNRKHRSPGRVGVFGKGAGVESPGLPIRDLALLQSLKPSQQQIMGIYKMPASKLGIVEDANRANMIAASQNYNENALLPRLRTFDEIVNSLLPRIFDNADNLAYESESPVDEDREAAFNEALKKLEAGTIKVNQFLNEVGAEDQGEDGEVYLIPATVKAVRSLSEAAAEPAGKATTDTSNSSGNEPPVTDPMDDAARAIAAAAAPLIASSKNIQIALLRRQLAEERFLRSQESLEAKAKSQIRAQFSRDLKEMRKALEDHFQSTRAVAVPHETRSWVDEAAKATREQWLAMIESIIEESVRAGWELFRSEVAGGLAFNIFDRNAAEYAKRQSASKITHIEATTVEQVRGVLHQAVENGWSVQETSRQIAELYDQFKGVRSETIARTETSSAMGWGKYQSARESAQKLSMTLQREWVAIRDGRTRSTHAAADGQTIGLHDTYNVGGFAMSHPGDPNAPADETVNCRCVEIYKDISE
jgi:HK97 family phage portal protein